MRKGIFALFAALMLLLGACGEEIFYEIKQDGKAYYVNTQDKTIFCEGTFYAYELNCDSEHYNLKIGYPNGSAWHIEERFYDASSTSTAGYTGDFKPQEYAPGDTLMKVLDETPVGKSRLRNPGSGNIFVGILLLVLGIAGIFRVFRPRDFWQLRYGYRYKDAEPTDMALVLERVAGVVMTVGAVILAATFYIVQNP